MKIHAPLKITCQSVSSFSTKIKHQDIDQPLGLRHNVENPLESEGNFENII